LRAAGVSDNPMRRPWDGLERATVQTTTLEELARAAKSLGRARFLEKHTHPFIILDWMSSQLDDLEAFSTADGGRISPFARVRPGKLPPPRTKCAAIVKRSNANEFANMVTVGRAGNNDLPLDVSSVSKFHAYFTKDPATGRWFIHDAGSSNGTWMNGERLEQSHGKMQLEDGCSIQIGPDASVRFYGNEALYEALAAASAAEGYAT
jgi:hypothetical protein